MLKVLLGVIACTCLPAAWAQEALQNLQTGRSSAQSRDAHLEGTDYTFKYEDLRVLLTPSVSLEWNDNVNVSQTGSTGDEILTPRLGLTASYPLTQRNVLFLDISIGYRQYFEHSALSSLDLNSSSGTGLSFDVGIKDVTLNFHDWMSYSQDATQNAAVVNTTSYGTFNNTLGLSALWDMNQANLSAGFDHRDVMSTSSQFNSQTHASETLYLRPGVKLNPALTVGVDGTATLTRYQQRKLNNNTAYTLGGFADWRPGKALNLSARLGYSMYQFNQSSASVTTSDQNSWYAGLTLNHQLRESIGYSLNIGHEVSLGVQSDLTENWYVRPNVNWRLFQNFTFTTGFFYEHGRQGVGNVTGNFSESYDQYGGNIQAGYALTKRLDLSAYYRLTMRTSQQAGRDYTQNVIGMQLTYHPR